MPSVADMRVVRTVTTRATTEGVSEARNALLGLAGAQDQVATSADRMATVTESSARRQTSVAGAWERMQRQYDPAISAAARFEQAQRTADRALAQGATTLAEHGRILDMARTRLGLAGAANDNLTKSIGLQRYEWVNLGQQANDAATMLLNGSSAFQVVATQGGQVLDVLQGAQGGIGGALKSVGSGMVALLTPARLAFGGILGLIGGAGAALLSYLGQQRELERSRNGIGRASGMSVGGLNRAAETYAGGARLSRSDARTYAAGFAATGRIGPDLYGPLLGTTRDLAKTLGVDEPEAAATLAKSFADPARGADQLNEKLGFLNDRSRRLIATYVEQGRLGDAQRTTLDALKSSLESATANVNAFAAAWDFLKRKASDAYDTVGQGIGRLVVPAPEQRLAELGDRYRREQERGAVTATTDEDKYRGIDPEHLRYMKGQGYTDAQIYAEAGVQPAPGAAPGTGPVNGPNRYADDYAYAQEDQRRRSQAGFSLTRNAQAAQESLEVGKLTDKYLDEADALSKLRNEVERLDKARSAPSFGMDTGRLADSYERSKGALDSWMSTEEKRRASDELSIRSINARTDAERAAIAVEQKRIELAGQALTSDERRRALDAARAAELARGAREAEDRRRAAEDQSVGAGQLPYQRGLAEIEQRFRRQNEASTGNARALAENARTRALEISNLNVEQVGGPLRGSVQALNEQNANLKVQRDSFLATTEAAGTMAAKQSLLNEYIRAGVPVTDELRRSIDGIASSYGRSAKASEEFQRTSQNVVAGMDEIRGSSRGLLTGIASDLRQGQSPLQGIKNQLGRMFDQMFDRLLSKPITEQLLGFDGKGGGGLIGNAVSKIFGDVSGVKVPGASPLPTLTSSMVVNAATVVVNGGLSTSGLTGLGATTGIPGLSGGAGVGPALLGFGVNGPQSAGTAARLGSALSTFGTGPNGTSVPSFSGSQSDFINKMMPAALEASQRTGVDPRMIIAQSAIETGWGRSAPGNNFFGIKGAGQVLSTREVLGGQDVQIRDSFRTYGGMDDSVRGYADFINGNSRYSGYRTAVGLDAQAAALQRSGYATDPTYGAKVLGIARGINLPSDRRADLGPSVNDNTPAGATDWGAASRSFSDSTDTASKSLDGLGDTVGRLPQSADAATGSLGSFISSLFKLGSGDSGGLGGLGKLASLGGDSGGGSSTTFAWGGYTGAGGRYQPAGVVHAGEVVWSQDDVARHGGWRAVDAMRLALPGYAAGGPVAPLPMPAPAPMNVNVGPSSMPVTLINQTSQPARAETRTNPQTGNREVILRDLDSGLAKRAGNGRGDLGRLSNANPAAYRVG